MSKVTVFGSFVVDLMARTPHLPVPGETVRGTMFRMGPGGKGFNQAVAAHKAGADVTIVTKLGRDSFAQVALNAMSELEMNQNGILYSEDSPTGCALISVDEKSGQNEIVIVPGALNTFNNAETDMLADTLADSEYVLLQLEVNQDANERVAELAIKNGCKVILNSAPYATVTDAFLSKCFMVTPNETEAEALTGIPIETDDDAVRAADYFHRRGVNIVLITLGVRGVFYSDGVYHETIPAFSVKAIDTTGAGDAFNGGLLAALAEQKALPEAIRFGQGTAALSVQKIGTTPAMPTRQEIDDFLCTRD